MADSNQKKGKAADPKGKRKAQKRRPVLETSSDEDDSPIDPQLMKAVAKLVKEFTQGKKGYIPFIL